MGISTALLCGALAIALVPAAVLRFESPKRARELTLALVASMATGWISYRLLDRWYGLHLLENVHFAYLLAVVTAPLLLGFWFVAGLRRGRRSWPLTAAGAAAAGLALAGIWGTHIEPNRLEVEHITTYANIETPITIGVLADLQTADVGQLEWNAVNALIDAQPDLVLVPGDLYQGPVDVVDAQTPNFVALLRALVDSVDQVAVVSGDHDANGQLLPIVEAAGATYMDNRSTDLIVRGQAVRLAGVAVRPSQDKGAIVAGLRTPTDAFSILLSHRPGITYLLPPDADIDLIVAGHTHGGQVQLPFVSDRIWYSDVPPSISNGGLNQLNDFSIYVSTGVGLERHTSPQVRFGVPPSVGIIRVLPTQIADGL